MTFVRSAILYVLTVPVFLLIDGIWLGVVAKNMYQQKIGHLMGPVNWPAAAIFYLLFIIGIIVFAVLPGLEKQSWMRTLGLGMLFGALAYATYDLTNLATLKNWPLDVTIIDIIWGAVLTGSVATISYFIATWLVKA